MISSCELGAFESLSSLVWAARPLTVPSSLWAPRGFWHMFPALGRCREKPWMGRGTVSRRLPPPPSISPYSQCPHSVFSGPSGLWAYTVLSARVPCWMGKKKPCGCSELREAPYGECEVSPHFTGSVSPVVLAPGQWKLNPLGKPRAWSRLSGGQFHLARPAFPVLFVAMGNKLDKYLPSHSSWQQCWQLILRKKKGKKKPSRIFTPLCLNFGEKVFLAAPAAGGPPGQNVK